LGSLNFALDFEYLNLCVFLPGSKLIILQIINMAKLVCLEKLRLLQRETTNWHLWFKTEFYSH